jgi:uncharacterized protein (TIGR02118 family)
VIKLIAFVKRKPGMSPEDFHEYWRNVHGPLVASTESGSFVRHYEQNHKPLAAYEHDDTGWDGVTVQWFDSVKDFFASINVEDYARIEADIGNFLDRDALQFVLTEEPEVIIDGGL